MTEANCCLLRTCIELTENVVRINAETEHTFEGRDHDWGFNSFALLVDVTPPEKGFLHNGALHLKVQIEVEHPDNYIYNSKKLAGFVGLKNQGATCYLNSLLQTLYNLNYFRKVSCLISISENVVEGKSMIGVGFA